MPGAFSAAGEHTRSMKVVFVLLFSAALMIPNAWAASKPPLTNEEMVAAYDQSVSYISARLKAPSTAQFCSLEQARFGRGRNWPSKAPAIIVKLTVDAQNSYGAMLRSNFTCKVSPDPRFPVFCFE